MILTITFLVVAILHQPNLDNQSVPLTQPDLTSQSVRLTPNKADSVPLGHSEPTVVKTWKY